MSKAWQPKNWEEACKRNLGRRKLHIRKRKERADRIVRMLVAMEAVPELRECAYGWLTLTAETMKNSKATASRDFALARRIYAQFARMFGRNLEPQKDQIKWARNRFVWRAVLVECLLCCLLGHRRPVLNG